VIILPSEYAQRPWVIEKPKRSLQYECGKDDYYTILNEEMGEHKQLNSWQAQALKIQKRIQTSTHGIILCIHNAYTLA
jgi:hypothetical protein